MKITKNALNRAIAYQTVIKDALPAMGEAEKYGARCTEHFVIFLNSAEQLAPNGKLWNPWACLEARKYLHKLGLGAPPLGNQAARDNRIGHDQRRAELLKRLEKAGKEFKRRKTTGNKLSPFVEG